MANTPLLSLLWQFNRQSKPEVLILQPVVLLLQLELLPAVLRVLRIGLHEGVFKKMTIRKQPLARFKLLCAQLIDASAERVPQKRLGPVLQLPPRHCQLNGSHDGLKAQSAA
jgi:hypothetical protein